MNAMVGSNTLCCEVIPIEKHNTAVEENIGSLFISRLLLFGSTGCVSGILAFLALSQTVEEGQFKHQDCPAGTYLERLSRW